MRAVKQLITILILFGFLLSIFSLSKNETIAQSFTKNETIAQGEIMKVPQDLEEVKVGGKRSLKTLPVILKEIWQDTLRIIKKIWQKIKNFWNSYISSKIKTLWQKILVIFSKEIEKRKSIIKEEFPKEKKELKEELPKVSKSLWERFKELIK